MTKKNVDRLSGVAGCILGPADRGGVGRVVGQSRAGGQGGGVIRAVIGESRSDRTAPFGGQRKANRLAVACTASLNVAVASLSKWPHRWRR